MSRYAFAEFELDRAAHWRQDASGVLGLFESREAKSVLLTESGRVLIARQEPRLLALPLPLLRDHFAFEQFSFLGLDREQAPWFALELSSELEQQWQSQLDAELADLRAAAALLPAPQAGTAAYARALLHWQKQTRFCARCGAKTLLSGSGHRALCTNPACAAEWFPRTDAAIITIVHDGQRCLLGRQPSWPEKRFSTLAGFLEPGESLEQAVAREVFEEVGVVVDRSHYFASQPWPFPASIMVGFIAEAKHQPVRLSDEIVEAGWFSAEELEQNVAAGDMLLSPKLSISRALIEHWCAEQLGRPARLSPP